MILPSFKNIISSDFPKQYYDLMNQLALLLNNTLSSVFQCLSNGVSINDNIACTVKDVTLTVNSSGTPANPAVFLLDTSNNVRGTTVIQAINQVNSTVYPTAAVMVFGAQNGNMYTINNVTGLQANTSYTIRVIAWQTS